MTKRLLGLALLAALAGLLEAQALDEVLASYYQANGGLEKLRAMQTLKLSGRMTLPATGVEMAVTMCWKAPAAMRSESRFQDRVIVQACDGQTAWWIMPFLGIHQAQPMPADQAVEILAQADIADPLVVYRERGHALELLGREAVGDAAAFALRLRRLDGREALIYIDAASGLELKTTTRDRRGGDALQEIGYGDYRSVQEVQRPFLIESRSGGRLVSRLLVSSWEINPPLSDDLFRLPVPPAKRP